MMKRLSLIGAGFVALAASSLVLADDAAGRPVPPRGGGPCGGILRALDADTNGELSAAEIANAPTTLLEMDTNGDGALSADELMPVPPGFGGGRGPGRGPGMGRGQGTGRGPGMGRGQGMGRGEGPRGQGGGILRHDTDGDGQVTLEEFTADVNKVFTALDADGDGVISAEEAQVRPEPGTANTGTKAKAQRRGR